MSDTDRVPMANHWIVTSNFTETGAVAWRRADGTWSPRFAESGLFPDEPAAKRVADAANAKEQREVADVYVIEVRAEGATLDPLTARERIRANGPTIPMRRPDRGVAR
jgi:hypothetical protein